MTKYSICMTTYNDVDTVESTLESIVRQITDEFEIVIVDNWSTDGTYEALESFIATGRIKLLREKCSRGKGRQIAFENSSGDYVISNMDADDVFNAVLPELLRLYHLRCEGKLLSVRQPGMPSANSGGAVEIAPRSLINQIGGWHDLNYYEDRDICARAALVGKYANAFFPLMQQKYQDKERTRTTLARARFTFILSKEQMRLGMFERSKLLTVKKLPIYITAWVASRFQSRYKIANIHEIAKDKSEENPWRIQLQP